MAILFPPIIESKIPAQAEYLKIYYTPNPMVTTFETLAIKIKTISTNTEIITGYVDDINQENNNYYFTYTPNKDDFLQENYLLEKGEFYKIQVAYVEEILTGDNKKNQLQNLYWSSVGIFKWTEKINPLTVDIDEYFKITCSCTLQDLTEPIQSYELILNKGQEIIYQYNGLQVSSNLTNSFEIQPDKDFPQGEYIIKLLITTINGYQQQVENEFKVEPLFEEDRISLTTNLNKEKLSFKIKANITEKGTTSTLPTIFEKGDVWKVDGDVINIIINGKAAKKGDIIFYNGSDWFLNPKCQIIRTDIDSSVILGALNQNAEFEDTTISHGEYTYSIRWEHKKRNNTIISYTQQDLNPILIDFEDMYLSDKDHLLCVRFNPKVSSFKETVLESKQDTIGGRYPFFFRNGNTKYKEFSINGLISYHMDNNETFLNRGHNSNTLQRQSTNDSSTDSSFIPTTQLTGRNVYEEREFKLAVLEWLNNGKPKLFRSPTEGAYLVRLMNISLSPEDQLGRMLHSFQATAYEIDECTLESLRKYNCLYEEE